MIHRLSVSDEIANEGLKITRSLVIKCNHSWVAYVNGLQLSHSCNALQGVPEILTTDAFLALLNKLEQCYACIGNPDDRFVELCNQRKGRFVSLKNEVTAVIQESEMAHQTIRHVSCQLLVEKENARCDVCTKYRSALRAMVSSSQKSKLEATKANYRFLRTPQRKAQLVSLRKRMKKAIADNKRLKKKLDNATSKSGIVIDSQLENDVLSLISINNDKANEFEVGAQDEFRKIFWEQQVHCVHCTSNYIVCVWLYTFWVIAIICMLALEFISCHRRR